MVDYMCVHPLHYVCKTKSAVTRVLKKRFYRPVSIIIVPLYAVHRGVLKYLFFGENFYCYQKGLPYIISAEIASRWCSLVQCNPQTLH